MKNRLNIAWLFLGLASELQVVASLSFLEVYILVATPFLLIKEFYYLKRNGILPFFWLSLLVVFGGIVGNFVHPTSSFFVLRKMAIVVIVSCSIVVCHFHWRKSPGGIGWFFLGHVQHGSRLFYGLMKYARVCCLPSNCETPGIAGLEGAALGARPVVPYEGGTCEYYGWDAEYHNSLSERSIGESVERAWKRGLLTVEEQQRYRRLTWNVCANWTLEAYGVALG